MHWRNGIQSASISMDSGTHLQSKVWRTNPFVMCLWSASCVIWQFSLLNLVNHCEGYQPLPLMLSGVTTWSNIFSMNMRSSLYLNAEQVVSLYRQLYWRLCSLLNLSKLEQTFQKRSGSCSAYLGMGMTSGMWSHLLLMHPNALPHLPWHPRLPKKLEPIL